MPHRWFLLVFLAIPIAIPLRNATAERLPPIRPVQNQARFREPETLPQPSSSVRAEPSQLMLFKAPEDVESSANETANHVSLDTLQQIALANNPTIVKASAAVQAACGNWTQVGLYPNPNVAYLATQIGDQSSPGQQGAYFEQEFVRGRKLPLNRAVAAREVEIARQDFAAQKMRVLNDVRIHFYAALVAQQQLEISRELVGIGSRALKAADDRLKSQEVSRIDVLQARVEANEAQIAMVNAQNRYQAAWRQIAALIGVPGMQEHSLDGNLLEDMPEFNWEESVGRILAESPELAATRSGVDRAIWALRRARAEPISNVTVQAGPQYDLGANQTITNVNVVLPAPIFNKNQGNIRRAEADVQAAKAEVNRKELELTTRLSVNFERYLNARNQVTQYREQIMPHAREALKLVGSAYEGGHVDYLSVLTTQRTFFRTNLAYLEALRELWECSITIDGLLLTDSLQAGGTMPTLSKAPAMPLPISPFMGK
jgi:outer membrane protein, heavy metal efflux system